MAKTLCPVGENVLLKIVEKEDDGGIYIPDESKIKEFFVEAISEEYVAITERDPAFKVGDKVVVDIYAGQPIQLDGIEYKVVKASDIIAIVKEEK